MMNCAFVCASLAETPREVYTSATSSSYCAEVILPRVSQNKSETRIKYHVYGKAAERFLRLKQNSLIYIHGATLRFDVQTKTHSLHAGSLAEVTESFPIFNDVILAGRCIKDIDKEDPRAFKTTADGTMICSQTLSVSTGRNQCDLFNFYAINNANDRLNLAELICNMTKKGTEMTLRGRLVTDAWNDKQTNERRTATKIQINKVNIVRTRDESKDKPVVSQTTVAAEGNVASLWGGKTVEDSQDAWNEASGGGLPELPGQYTTAPVFASDEPF